jgi:hypothetical protein
MKKALVIFILLLLAVPAMATITVTATCSGTASPYTVTVSYSIGAGDTIAPRAFGLLISCDANGTIGTVSPVTTNYYVAPGTFDYNSVSGVVTWGNPVVSKTNNSFILEVGSLYATNDAQHPAAPPTSGTLLTFPLTVPTGKSTVSIAVDSARGGVVREDPSVTGNVTLTGCTTTDVPTLCFPSTSNYAKQMSDFKLYKSYQPSWDGACWCGGTKWKYQCDGDILGTTEGALTKYRVYKNDYTALASNWAKKISDTTLNPCADIRHDFDGNLTKYRVYKNDYNRLSSNWAKKDSQLPGNCPRPDGSN